MEHENKFMDNFNNGKLPTVEIYRNQNNRWQWRIKSRNGNVICNSPDEYNGLEQCKFELQTLMQAIRDCKVVDKGN